MDFFAGEVIAIDKPYEWTSFGLVARVRWLLTQHLGSKLKVGHAGTLDPLATGVVLLCTGKATKRIEELQAQDKEYTATLRLGATTPSFDLEHAVDATYPTGHITEEAVREALRRFEGDIKQVPPAFSACKIEGKRAYKMARKGEDVTLDAKTVRIDTIELTGCRLPDEIDIRVVCGKGTYIRALARDIGEALGSGAHLVKLRRTRVGHYRAEDCMTLDGVASWIASLPVTADAQTAKNKQGY